MQITKKRLKEIIAEEMQKLDEMYDTSSDTRAAMEGTPHMAALDIVQSPDAIRVLLGAISTLRDPVGFVDQLAQAINNPMGPDGKTPQWEAYTRTKKRIK
jgi:hypothetical protein